MKVLIISAAAGTGHLRAAQALEETLRLDHPDAEVRNVDILEYTEPVYRTLYGAGYPKMADHAPSLWGYLYKHSDKKKARKKLKKLVSAFDRLEFRRFRQMLRDFAPDVLLCTHFLPCQILTPYRDEPWANFRIGVVVTDFDIHRYWCHPIADRTFVSTPEAVEVAVSHGVERDRISIAGIPIMRAFSQPPEHETARRALELTGEAPVLLAMGGGWGGGSLLETVQTALDVAPVQVIAVAGKNEALREELAALDVPEGSRLLPLGYVNNVPELMAAADLFLGKAGGLSTSECLATGLPMLLPEPIPGQEERNADYLVEAGAALKARSRGALVYKLRRLLQEPELRRRLREAALSASHPHAAQTIVQAMLGAEQEPV